MAAPVRADLTARALLAGVRDLLRAYPAPLGVPFIILFILLGSGASNADVLQNFADIPRDPTDIVPFFVFSGFLGFLVSVLLYATCGALWLATTRAAFMPLLGEGAPDFALAWRAVRPVLPGGLVAFLLWGLAVVLGYAVLILPGLLLMAVLAPWAAVVVAEGVTGMDAIRRAWILTNGHRVELFQLAFLGFIVVLVAQFALSWIPGVGPGLAGAVTGVAFSATATLAAVFYQRRTASAPALAMGHAEATTGAVTRT